MKRDLSWILKNIRQAVIFAGGLGTRLRPFTENNPKPMYSFNGKPFLAYLIEQARSWGIKDVIILLGYLPEKIMDYLIATLGRDAVYADRIIRKVEEIQSNPALDPEAAAKYSLGSMVGEGTTFASVRHKAERTAKNKAKIVCTTDYGYGMKVYRATKKNGKYKLIKKTSKNTFTNLQKNGSISHHPNK